MGAQMRYPYTTLGKIAHFPTKYYWKNGRFIRYTAYAWLICLPVFYSIGKAGEFNYLHLGNS